MKQELKRSITLDIWAYETNRDHSPGTLLVSTKLAEEIKLSRVIVFDRGLNIIIDPELKEDQYTLGF